MEAEEKLKRNKPNPRNNKCISIEKLRGPKFFEDAVKQIKACLSDNRHELSNVIIPLLAECPPKELREATMYIYISFWFSFNKEVSPNITKDCEFVMEQLIQCFEYIMANKNEEFVAEVNGSRFANNIFKNSFKHAVKLNVLKYSDVLRQIFDIRDRGDGRLLQNKSKEKWAYVYIKYMFYDLKYQNNAVEWIRTFGFNFRKFAEVKEDENDDNDDDDEEGEEEEVAPDNIVIPPDIKNNAEWETLVEETSKELCNIYSSGLVHQFSPCIDEFYVNCLEDWIRGASMYLICVTDFLMSKLKGSDSSLVIFQIFIGLQKFLDEKGTDFTTRVLSVKVSDELRNKSFKIAIRQKRVACYNAMFSLYHIHQPDGDTSKMIYENVGELLGDKETFVNGVEKFHTFQLDLENLKIPEIIQIEKEDTDANRWVEYVENLYNEIQKLDYDFDKINYALQLFYVTKRKEDIRRQKLDERFAELHRNTGFKIDIELCPLDLVRRATMELILKTDLKNENSTELNFQICSIFYFAVHKDYKKAIKSVIIPDDVWNKAWEICSNNSSLQALKSSSALKLLFRIDDPETKERKQTLYDTVRSMISKTETFHNAINWINTFNLTKLKEELFGHVVIYSFLFEGGKQTVFNNFPAKKDKIRYAKILDELLYQLVNDQLPSFLKKYNKAFTFEKLYKEVDKLATELKIDMEAENYYTFQAKYIQEKQTQFEFMQREHFEILILEEFEGDKYKKNEKYKQWLLQSLSSDKAYAYCWAKYFEISDNDLPKELRSCIVSGIDYKKFIQDLSKRVHHLVDKDNVEICKFWGKAYEVHTIITSESFFKFIDDFLIKSKPAIAGIDCEAGESFEAVTLQLYIHGKLFLIDLMQLSESGKISKDQWIKFFELLFDPIIIRVGFAADNEYKLLCKKFPFLKEFFRDPKRNFLCLQKLAIYFLQDKQIMAQLLCNEISEKLSLAKFTKAVLNITMDKSEQTGKWMNRPLTLFQKIYAVTDALMVVLLMDRIEETLKKIYPDEVNEIMKNGYIFLRIDTFQDLHVSKGKVYLDGNCKKTVTLKNYDIVTVTQSISFSNKKGYSKDFATIARKLDLENVKEIKLDRQAFKLENLKKYVHFEKAEIYNNDIKKEDDTDADPADIFKLLKNVKIFVFRHDSNMFKKETAANLLKEPHFAKLEQLILHNVTKDFDFDAFLNGIKNIHPNIDCGIYFKKDAFAENEFEALKDKCRRIPPTIFPNCDFGEMDGSKHFTFR